MLRSTDSSPRLSFLVGGDPEEPQTGLVFANQLLEKHCTTISRYSASDKEMLEELMTEQNLTCGQSVVVSRTYF